MDAPSPFSLTLSFFANRKAYATGLLHESNWNHCNTDERVSAFTGMGVAPRKKQRNGVVMDQHTLAAFAQELRRRRAETIAQVADTQDELEYISEERESEWSDRSLEERMMHLLSRLDVRQTEELRELDAALERMRDGVYGRCANCGADIAVARLQARPTARFCQACAHTLETPDLRAAEENVDFNRERVQGLPAAEEDEMPESGYVPPDLSTLSDDELEEVIRDQVREDGRVEAQELEVQCRNGVVMLSGALPSERERSILLQLITDVLGFQDVVDHIEVEELAWQREDRDPANEPPAQKRPPDLEHYGTDDVVESTEEVLTEPPPLGQPTPEEQ
jgi:RNA polymerase-binding protein DksA